MGPRVRGSPETKRAGAMRLFEVKVRADPDSGSDSGSDNVPEADNVTLSHCHIVTLALPAGQCPAGR